MCTKKNDLVFSIIHENKKIIKRFLEVKYEEHT